MTIKSNACGCLAAILFCVILGAAAADDLPEGVVNTQSTADVSLTPEESLARMRVPAGFHVTLFAGEPHIRRPIAFDMDDRGRLWVVENYSHPVWRDGEGVDRIVILEDTDHDGDFDERRIFWDKGRYLTAIAIGHGGVWVANTPELAFIPDRNGDDVPDSEPEVKLDGFTRLNHNNVLNNFHWGPDGWLYGAIGQSAESLVGKPGSGDEARRSITRGMWRYHPIDGRFEVLAHGMVNPWGADFNEFGDLFTANTVIAHLWHIVPGMYCQRRGFEKDNPYAYGRIQSISDHLHWGGGTWQASRQNEEHHSIAGGGHAHCGAMIYLGDNWPDEYRGTFFTGNLHGNRINQDQLVPRGSSYLGIHRPDFLLANDLWFRSMSQKYGPDGGVYISDWHDFGECHDSDGSHRSSGRIYKVVYGTPEIRQVDLQHQTNEQLADLHAHQNEWLVRHARRILFERASSGKDVSAADQKLRHQLASSKETVQRLRALWTLKLTGAVAEGELIELANDHDPHIRRWCLQLLVNEKSISDAAKAVLQQAAHDDSPAVRLAVACALQRLPLADRWSAAEGLLTFEEDADDAYLPLMIWYGVETLFAEDLQRALALLSQSRIPALQRFAARRALDGPNPNAAMEMLVQRILDEDDDAIREQFLQGIVDATANLEAHDKPTHWDELYQQVELGNDHALKSLAALLATFFGDEQVLARLRASISDAELAIDERRSALASFLRLSNQPPTPLLQQLVRENSTLRPEALAALELHADSETGKLLLDSYDGFSRHEKSLAIAALVTRHDTVELLLAAVEQNHVPHQDISAYALQQLRAIKEASIKAKVDELWQGETDRLAKADQIAYYKQLLTPTYMESGDASAGRLIFDQTCAKCHSLFGEGGSLAPGLVLTGSGRADLDYILSNLVDPSGFVDPAYRVTTVVTVDGRVFHGFLIQHTERFVQLRTQAGEIKLNLNDIELLETSDKSMMPEGLLQSYTNEEVRDLIKYLASPEQVPLRQAQ